MERWEAREGAWAYDSTAWLHGAGLYQTDHMPWAARAA